MPHILKVSDFHPKPYGRLPEHDPEANGQLFRTKVLLKALATHREIVIDFSGIALVGASFLDEAVAGLIYHDGFREAELRERITLRIPQDPTKVETTWRFVSEAESTVHPKARASRAQRHALHA